MDEAPLHPPEDQIDYALNQARILRNQLRAVTPPPAAPPGLGAERKTALHEILDTVQRWTPAFLRALIRPVYLKLYYRAFPEHAPGKSTPSPAPCEEVTAVHSGY